MSTIFENIFLINSAINNARNKFNAHNKHITFGNINNTENKEPFLNFDFINGVPVFIFNDKWTLNGAQAPKVIETIIDIAAKD